MLHKKVKFIINICLNTQIIDIKYSPLNEYEVDKIKRYIIYYTNKYQSQFDIHSFYDDKIKFLNILLGLEEGQLVDVLSKSDIGKLSNFIDTHEQYYNKSRYNGIKKIKHNKLRASHNLYMVAPNNNYSKYESVYRNPELRFEEKINFDQNPNNFIFSDMKRHINRRHRHPKINFLKKEYYIGTPNTYGYSNSYIQGMNVRKNIGRRRKTRDLYNDSIK